MTTGWKLDRLAAFRELRRLQVTLVAFASPSVTINVASWPRTTCTNHPHMYQIGSSYPEQHAPGLDGLQMQGQANIQNS